MYAASRASDLPAGRGAYRDARARPTPENEEETHLIEGSPKEEAAASCRKAEVFEVAIDRADSWSSWKSWRCLQPHVVGSARRWTADFRSGILHLYRLPLSAPIWKR